VGESDKAGVTPNDKVSTGRIVEEGNNFSKKGISTEEATKFLRIIQ